MRARKLLGRPAVEAVLAVGLAIAAAAVVLIASAPHGPRVSTDSAYYLSAADSVRGGHGLVTFDGITMTHWPPGFSVVLVAMRVVAGSTVEAARVLNALCLAAVVLLGWGLLSRYVRSPALRLAGVAGIAAAPTLQTIAVAAWSEPLFVALLLASLLALVVALEPGCGRRWFALAGFLAGSSVAARYSGTWAIVTGLVIVLLANRRISALGDRVRSAALFLLFACIVPAFVVVRNLGINGSEPFGFRGDSQQSLGHALSDTANGIWKWLMPEGGSTAVRVILVAALVFVTVACVVALRRGPGAAPSGAAAPRSSPAAWRAPLWPVALMLGTYIAFLLVSAKTQELDPIDRRLLSPAFVICVVLVFGLGARAPRGRAVPRSLIAAGAVAACAWLVGEIQTTRIDAQVIRRQGAGFAQAQYRDSALAALIRRRRPPLSYSDAPDEIYLLTSAHSACWPTPAPTVCNGWPLHRVHVSATRPAYIAWFSYPGAVRPVVPPTLARPLRGYEFVAVEKVSDGTLFALRARKPRSP
jgi:4-amino-4-deoxy-L-arabinose transferase-like glycosyltransferase